MHYWYGFIFLIVYLVSHVNEKIEKTVCTVE